MPSEEKNPALSIEVVVTNPFGLHLRSCNEVTAITRRYASTITFLKNERKADAKSMLALLTLAATCGTRLTVTAAGEDAQAALDALKVLFDKPAT